MAGGINDSVIIFGIIVFLIALGILIPFVNKSFEVKDTTSINTEGMDVFLNQNNPTGTHCEWRFITIAVAPIPYYVCGIPDSTELNAYDVYKSIGKMFFWTFGEVPLLIDLLLLLPLRILLGFLIYRALRSGGG